MRTTVLFAKSREAATIPTKSRKGDTAWNFYPCFDETEIVIPKGEVRLVPTGIHVSCDESVAPIVFERGGCGLKGLSLRGRCGDSNFTGEYQMIISNPTNKQIIITKRMWYIGDKIIHEENRDAFTFIDYNKAIAQIAFLQLADAQTKVLLMEEFLEVNSNSERGVGMLGSSDDLKDVDDSEKCSNVIKEDVEIGQQTGEVLLALTPEMTELITSLVGELVPKIFPETVVIGAPVVDTETIKNLTTVVEEVVEPAKTLEATETTEKVEKVEDDVKPEKVSKPKADSKTKKETAPKAPKTPKTKVVKETETKGE